jgi:hypothetical protein
MHSHNEEVTSLLDSYLPSHYTTEALRRLTKLGLEVSAAVVRNARNGRQTKHMNVIIGVLVGMANDEKAAVDRLSELITSSK